MPRPPRRPGPRGRSPKEKEALQRQLDRDRRNEQRERDELYRNQADDWVTFYNAEHHVKETTGRQDQASYQARAQSVVDHHQRQQERLAEQQRVRAEQQKAQAEHQRRLDEQNKRR